MSQPSLNTWWSALRHEGLLLDVARLARLEVQFPRALPDYQFEKFAQAKYKHEAENSSTANYVHFVLEQVCGFRLPAGVWKRGGSIPASLARKGLSGETLKPNQVYLESDRPTLAVFLDPSGNRSLGIGHSRVFISHVLEWMRLSEIKLALVTNGRQWRILYAGIDHEAFSEWDSDTWIFGGKPTDTFNGFLALLQPALWRQASDDAPSLLYQAVQDSRRGQNELSDILGERVRQAVELLIQAHGLVLEQRKDAIPASAIYNAAVHVVMRMVVMFFAESRDGLLPKDNAVFNASYSLQGLIHALRRQAANPASMRESHQAWPRILSYFRLLFVGSDHEALPVQAYGGELFAPGDPASADPVKRAVAVFEDPRETLVSDSAVLRMLDCLSTTLVHIRHGKSAHTVSMPVDFSSLGNEYIGILFEGLLSFELRHAAESPVVFLNVGDQPALPLADLERMDDSALKDLFGKFKKAAAQNAAPEESEPDEEPEDTDSNDEPEDLEESDGPDSSSPDSLDAVASLDSLASPTLELPHSRTSELLTVSARVEAWTVRVCEALSLVRRPSSKDPAAQLRYRDSIRAAAAGLVAKTVAPGDWYLVRWGGTRKGSGTFYTKPQLAITTTVRTLRPLAYDADQDSRWIPKPPEDIIGLKVCDPSCGSGSFLLASLRYLSEALYASLVYHKRFDDPARRTLHACIYQTADTAVLGGEDIPGRPGDDGFEERVKAMIRRYVVEQCIYGVDLDPLGVELCRLSLWIETLDRELPMTFLEHKVKCGNSLVGTWFDKFTHYPLMAWAREGGDKNHKNGVHYRPGQRDAAIKEKFRAVKSRLEDFIRGQTTFWSQDDIAAAKTEYAAAIGRIREIHALNIADAASRAERYAAFRAQPGFQSLKDAFDLWCALWFWPAEDLDAAPMPDAFSCPKLTAQQLCAVRQIAAQERFFHWELEFPEVFSPSVEPVSSSQPTADCRLPTGIGFSAIVGNPPWDIAKPKSEEFFSALDPLYRSLGKQPALKRQTELFTDTETEARWLTYSAHFKDFGNWVAFCGDPFDTKGETIDPDISARWQRQRDKAGGWDAVERAFRYQGDGDTNLYKTFLEQAYNLASASGRIGMIVPAGIYSDNGCCSLRRLFLNHTKWEWLFSISNTKKIFAIHLDTKFNPIILQKGSTTKHILTAFLRQELSDWEDAERFAMDYPVDQIARFSPDSLTFLEFTTPQDLHVVSAIYKDAELLGDPQSSWQIQFGTEFHMTSDSQLFPPKHVWEEWDYQPDEYSRWIKGNWKSIESLYELPEVATHVLAAPIVDAQPPYNVLRIKRLNIPQHIILSHDALRWIRLSEIPTVLFTDADGNPLTKTVGKGKNKVQAKILGPAIALPLYQGGMIHNHDFSYQIYVSGSGRKVVWGKSDWANKRIISQFLMAQKLHISSQKLKTVARDVTNPLNSRTILSAVIPPYPCGNKTPLFTPADTRLAFLLSTLMSSFVFDFATRIRLTGKNLNWHIAKNLPLISPNNIPRTIRHFAERLQIPDRVFAQYRTANETPQKLHLALTPHERLRCKVILDAAFFALARLGSAEVRYIMADCDHPTGTKTSTFNQKGFWRVDKTRPPELRQTVLTMVAFFELEKIIASARSTGGTPFTAVETFCALNNGEGWHLPETLRLSDYGLGHDERAKQPQPVRETFGPRFYPWQLAQSPEEAWAELQIHAQNLQMIPGAADADAALAPSAAQAVAAPQVRQAAPIRTDLTLAMFPQGKERFAAELALRAAMAYPGRPVMDYADMAVFALIAGDGIAGAFKRQHQKADASLAAWKALLPARPYLASPASAFSIPSLKTILVQEGWFTESPDTAECHLNGSLPPDAAADAFIPFAYEAWKSHVKPKSTKKAVPVESEDLFTIKV